MAETTDMSDNASTLAILAEQTAVVGLLNDNPPTAISMDAQQPDSLMTDAVDAATEQTISTSSTQPPITSNTTTTTPAATMGPSRTGTPSHANGTGNETPSRAASVVEEKLFIPTTAQKNGAPGRQWLNEKVTMHMLEITKRIAIEQPENPLRVLAEFFDQRATELGQ